MKLARLSLLLLLIVVLGYLVYNKKNKRVFEISGNAKNYNGRIYLYPEARKSYYNGFNGDSTDVKNGKFKFSLDFFGNDPLAFHLALSVKGGVYRTDRFILEPKDHHIEIDTISNNLFPVIRNNNQQLVIDEKDLREKNGILVGRFMDSIASFKKAKISKEEYLNRQRKAQEMFKEQSDSLILSFTARNPNSYAGLWEIIVKQTYEGYSTKVQDAFKNLSQELKESSLGIRFKEDLDNIKKVSLGSNFPVMGLKSIDLKKVELDLKKSKNSKFTFIDFWFSNCGPCLKQFPDLKNLHGTFKKENLRIIGISTDVTKNVEKWQDVVEERELTWYNFLDENGDLSSSMGINKFPTNFLLDENGKIIRRDLSILELERFLNDQ